MSCILIMEKSYSEKIELLSVLFGIKKEKLQAKHFTSEELNEIYLTLKADQLCGLPLLCDESMFNQIVAA